jgi:hypothetical protein
MNGNARRLVCIAVLSLLALLMFVHFASASTDWVQAIDGAPDNCAYGITSSSDGGYVLVGDSDSLDGNGYTAWIMALDSSGDTQWRQEFTGLGDSQFYSVAPANDGGYIATGCTSPSVDDNKGAWLLKTDDQGNMQWNQTYGGDGDNKAFSVIQTSDDGYVFSGYTDSSGQGNDDFWLVKTDGQGDLQWNQTFGGDGTDQAYSVVQTDDGGFAVAGQTDSAGNGGNDALLVKTDSNGNMEWNQTFGDADNDGAFSVIQTSDSGYALAGYTDSDQGGYNSWIVKADSSGDAEWQKTYSDSVDTQALSLVQTDDDGYLLAGYTNSYGSTGSQIWLDKIDPEGNSQWTQTFGGKGDDGAFAVTKTDNETYAIAGYTDSQTSDGSSIWVAQINDTPTTTSSAISPTELTVIVAIAAIALVLVSALAYRRKVRKNKK